MNFKYTKKQQNNKNKNKKNNNKVMKYNII